MDVRKKAALALAFVVLELSFWSIFLKIGGSSIGLIPQLFYGFLVGSIVSIGVSLAVDRGKGLLLIAKDRNMLLLVVVMGLLNNALTQLFLGAGTLGTNPSIAAVVYRSYVIMIALLTPFVVRHKVRRMQLLAAVVGFLGVYVILSGGTLFAFSASAEPFIVLLLVSALCTCFSGLFMNRYTFNVFGAVVIFNLSSLILTGALAAATHTGLIVSFTPGSIISVLFLGAFAYGLGTSLVYYSIKVYGAVLFGNVILLVPFLSIVLAALFTNTPILGYYLLAAVLMSAGIVLQRRYSRVTERITSKKLTRLTVFDVTGAFAGSKSPVITGKISGSNRALAMRLPKSSFDEWRYDQIFSKLDCITFTSEKPHDEVGHDEITFINDILGIGAEETALVAIGNPNSIENAFGELLRRK